MVDSYREQIARNKMLMLPVSPTGYYQQFSEDERGNPTDMFAENAFAWKAVVYTWDQVAHPKDEKLRNPTYNITPHDAWIFHSVRFAINTMSDNA